MFSLIHSGKDGNTYKEPRYWSRYVSKEVMNGLNGLNESNESVVFGYLKNWFCGLTSYPPQTDEELSAFQTVLVNALYAKEVGLGDLAYIALFAKQDGVAEFRKIAKGAFDILIHCVCNSPIDRLDNPVPHIQYRIFDYTWRLYYDWKNKD